MLEDTPVLVRAMCDMSLVQQVLQPFPYLSTSEVYVMLCGGRPTTWDARLRAMGLPTEDVGVFMEKVGFLRESFSAPVFKKDQPFGEKIKG